MDMKLFKNIRKEIGDNPRWGRLKIKNLKREG